MEIIHKLNLSDIKLGTDWNRNKYVMFKLRHKKFHPEVGAEYKGWIYGFGYDLNKDWSIDIFGRKKWLMKGKPGWGMGISYRI